MYGFFLQTFPSVSWAQLTTFGLHACSIRTISVHTEGTLCRHVLYTRRVTRNTPNGIVIDFLKLPKYNSTDSYLGLSFTKPQKAVSAWRPNAPILKTAFRETGGGSKDSIRYEERNFCRIRSFLSM